MKNQNKLLLPDITGISECTQRILSCFKRGNSSHDSSIVKAVGDSKLAQTEIRTLLSDKYPIIRSSGEAKSGNRFSLTNIGQVFMFPHLFVNGKINNVCGFLPLHGPTVIAALRALINLMAQGKQPSTKQLYEAIGAPDFGSPTTIIGKDYLKGYETGTAVITVQGVFDTVKRDDKQFVVIESGPPGISLEDLYRSVQESVSYRTSLRFNEGIWIETTDPTATVAELINYTEFRQKLVMNHRFVNSDGSIQEDKSLIELFNKYLESLYEHVELLLRGQQPEEDTSDIETETVLDGMDQYLEGLLSLVGNTERQTTISTLENKHYLTVANHEEQDWIVTVSGEEVYVRGIHCELNSLNEGDLGITCNSRDSIILVTDLGCYKVVPVPQLTIGCSLLRDIVPDLKGTVIRMIRSKPGESRHLCVITKFGYGKITKPARWGSRLIGLREGDRVGDACWVDPGAEVLILRQSGRGFRLSVSRIPEYNGPETVGRIMAKKIEDDPVVGIVEIKNNEDFVFVLCRHNYKMLQASDVPVYRQGAEGCVITGKDCIQLWRYSTSKIDLKIVSTDSARMVEPEHVDVPTRRRHGKYCYKPLVVALEIQTVE